MGECPACGNDDDAERELKRLNKECRHLATLLEDAHHDRMNLLSAMHKITDILPWDSYSAKQMLDIAESAIECSPDGKSANE